jgi:hypothetical protein
LFVLHFGEWLRIPSGSNVACCSAAEKRGAKMAGAVQPAYVEDRVIDYFSGRFNTAPSKFNQDTDCKDDFGFGDGDWRSLSDVFNQMNWMNHIRSHLTRQDMQECTTVGELTARILANTQS